MAPRPRRPCANVAEAFYERVFAQHENKVGVIMVGVSSMEMRGGDWGPGVRLGNDEILYSRQAVNKVGDVVVTRLATRIESEEHCDDYPARVAVAILVEREACLHSKDMAVYRPPVPRQQTIGAKLVHLLPLEFHSHQVSSRDEYQPGRLYSNTHNQCLLGSAFTIIGSWSSDTVPPREVRSTLNSSVGHAVPVLAARILGSDSVKDCVPYKPVENVTYAAWISECTSRADALSRTTDTTSTHHAFTDAERVLEMLSPYYLLQLMTSRFSAGALPDMVHSPLGVPLLIAMATSVAMNWRRYGLASPSDTDRMASEYLREALVAHWSPLSTMAVERFLAIDCALKSGYSYALAKTKKSTKARDRMVGNLTLLQRIGQRVITECYAQRPSPPLDRDTGKPAEIPSLLKDPFAKIVAMHAEACNAEIVGVRHEVNTMGHMEVVDSLLSHFNTVELWFRTGRYGDTQLSAPNEEVKDFPPECVDADDDVYKMVNLTAVHRGGEVFRCWCIDGPMCCFELLCMQTILVAPFEHAPCCWCGEPVHALPANLLRVGGAACGECGRRRCFMCSSMIVKARDHSCDPCTFCGTCEDARRDDDVQDEPQMDHELDSPHKGGTSRRAEHEVADFDAVKVSATSDDSDDSDDAADDEMLMDLLLMHEKGKRQIEMALASGGDAEICLDLLTDITEHLSGQL